MASGRWLVRPAARLPAARRAGTRGPRRSRLVHVKRLVECEALEEVAVAGAQRKPAKQQAAGGSGGDGAGDSDCDGAAATAAAAQQLQQQRRSSSGSAAAAAGAAARQRWQRRQVRQRRQRGSGGASSMRAWRVAPGRDGGVDGRHVLCILGVDAAQVARALRQVCASTHHMCSCVHLLTLPQRRREGGGGILLLLFVPSSNSVRAAGVCHLACAVFFDSAAKGCEGPPVARAPPCAQRRCVRRWRQSRQAAASDAGGGMLHRA